MPPTIGGVERAAPAVSALAVSLALIALVQQLRRRLQVEVPGGAGSSTSGSRSPTKDVPTSRTPAETAVRFSNKLSPEHADEHGRVYGGELLKVRHHHCLFSVLPAHPAESRSLMSQVEQSQPNMPAANA